MIKDKSLWTQTLADVYAGQGYWGEAAEIYRHLLEQSPGNREYLDALGEIRNRSTASEPVSSVDPLVGLMSTWLDLEMGYARLNRLKSLQTVVSSHAEGAAHPTSPKS